MEQKNLDSFQQQFESKLDETNGIESRRIAEIHILVQAHLQHARLIATCIITRLVKMNPLFRLPLFYILDSLVKDRKTRKTFIPLFNDAVSTPFLESMQKADEKLRARFLKLLVTWVSTKTFDVEQMKLLHEKCLEISQQTSKKRPAPNDDNSEPPAKKPRPSPDSPTFSLEAELQNTKVLIAARQVFNQLVQDYSSFPYVIIAAEKVKSLVSGMEVLQIAQQVATRLKSEPDVIRQQLQNKNLQHLLLQQQQHLQQQLCPVPVLEVAKEKETKTVVVPLPSFDMEYLKSRDEEAIHALVDFFPVSCTTCGQRFPDESTLQVHMKWHFRVKDKTDKQQQTKSASQGWFLKLDEWSSYDEEKYEAMLTSKMTDLDLNVATTLSSDINPTTPLCVAQIVDYDNRKICAPAIDSQPNCPICNEKFIQFHDEDGSWLCSSTLFIDDKLLLDETLTKPKQNTSRAEHLRKTSAKRLQDVVHVYAKQNLHSYCFAACIEPLASSPPDKVYEKK